MSQLVCTPVWAHPSHAHIKSYSFHFISFYLPAKMKKHIQKKFSSKIYKTKHYNSLKKNTNMLNTRTSKVLRNLAGPPADTWIIRRKQPPVGAVHKTLETKQKTRTLALWKANSDRKSLSKWLTFLVSHNNEPVCRYIVLSLLYEEMFQGKIISWKWNTEKNLFGIQWKHFFKLIDLVS